MRNDMNEIIDKYYLSLYKLAFVRLQNEPDAEDIVQEVFEKYLKNTKEFNDEEHERKWLIKVTLNLCKNFSMSAWNKYTVPLNEDCIKIEDEDYEDALEEIESLKDIYKEVVQLYYYKDLPIKRISKILKISESNVRIRLNRARNELKGKIERRKNYD